VRACVCACVCM